MRMTTMGLAAILCAPFAGEAIAGSVQDAIQNEEDPGSEIEMDVGPRGNVTIGREKALNPPPVQLQGQGPLDVPNDPDAPTADDPVDAERPGEGPEDLSGPDDDDDLPQ